MRMENKYLLFCWVVTAPGVLSSDGGGAAQHSEVKMQGRKRAGSHWNLDLKKFLHILPDCECFVKLSGAYSAATAAELCRSLHSGTSWPARISPSLILLIPHSAGSREPAISSWLSSSGSSSPAMCLNLAALTPAVTQHPASCFLPEPLRTSTSLSFLTSIAHTHLTGCALKLMQNSFAAFTQGTTCHEESATDLLPVCKTARQAPK